MSRRLPRLHAAATLAAVAVPLAVAVALPWHDLQRADVDIDRTLHRDVLAHRGVASAARAVTHLGDPLVVTAVTVAVAVVLALVGRRSAALYLLAVRAVAVAVGTLLKHEVGRPRPDLAAPLAHAAGASFPSGHAMGSAALWASLAVLVTGRRGRRIATVVAVVVPLAVAATRVVLGVHFVTDVLAGVALGWSAALAVAVAVRPYPYDGARPETRPVE